MRVFAPALMIRIVMQATKDAVTKFLRDHVLSAASGGAPGHKPGSTGTAASAAASNAKMVDLLQLLDILKQVRRHTSRWCAIARLRTFHLAHLIVLCGDGDGEWHRSRVVPH